MSDKQAANATVDDHLRSMLALMKRGAVVSLTDIPNDPTFISSHIYRDMAKAIAERIEAALSPAPQEHLQGIDLLRSEVMKLCCRGYDPALARGQLNAIVDAWEALPGGRHVRNSDVEEWLAEDMAPAINSIRGFLQRPRPDGVTPPSPSPRERGQ